MQRWFERKKKTKVFIGGWAGQKEVQIWMLFWLMHKSSSQEGLCKQHGAQIKRCSSKGCINQAQRGGVFAMHGAKVKQCSSEGCTNKVVNGRAWIRYWSKKKLCSNEGCTNQAKQRGRHGAYRNTQNGSTAFGSEYEMTTATQTSPNQRTSSRVVVREGQERSSVPEEVTICQEIVEVWCALCWVDVW